MAKRHFKKDVFDFLNELESNNEKTWWENNKDRYIAVIREPALEFINDFEVSLKKISPHFVADSRTVGGSLMRPYRDVRFSKDKTPYKTNVGIQFRHEQGKDVHAPGFYVHIPEPVSPESGSGNQRRQWRELSDRLFTTSRPTGRGRPKGKPSETRGSWKPPKTTS